MFSARENRCRRFQSNIFNKSKCKNCFKTVDSHKLSEADLYQVKEAVWPLKCLADTLLVFSIDILLFLSQSKPVQVGWLLLAPECTDFSNPGHRKRVMTLRLFSSDTRLLNVILFFYKHHWSFFAIFSYIEMAEEIFCVVRAWASTLLFGWDGEVLMLMCSCRDCLCIGWGFLF